MSDLSISITGGDDWRVGDVIVNRGTGEAYEVTVTPAASFSWMSCGCVVRTNPDGTEERDACDLHASSSEASDAT